MSKLKFQMESMEKKDEVLYISNEIIKTRHKLSVLTQKILWFFISDITFEERKQGIFLNEQTYKIEEIYNFMCYAGLEDTKDLKGRLKNVFSELDSNTIEISSFSETGKEIWRKYPWYSKLELNEEDNIFIFKFNSDISSLFLNLKKYFKSNLSEYIKLKTSYAIRLYTLLRAEQYKNIKGEYPLEYLKKSLGIEQNNAYDRWSNFQEKILKPSVAQLNKNTNFNVSYKTRRIGRKIGEVHFKIVNKQSKEEFENLFKKEVMKRISKINFKYSIFQEIFKNIHYSFLEKKGEIQIRVPFDDFNNKPCLNEEYLDFGKFTPDLQKIAETLIDNKNIYRNLDNVYRNIQFSKLVNSQQFTSSYNWKIRYFLY